MNPTRSHKWVAALVTSVIAVFWWVQTGNAGSPPEGHAFATIPPGAEYVEGDLLVRFAPKAGGEHLSTAEKNGILTSLCAGTVKHNYTIVPGLSLVRLPAGIIVKDALTVFNNVSGILYAEPNYRTYVASTFPNDPYFEDEKQWGLHNTGETGGTVDADIDAPEAWDTATDSDIIVAVIDTGIDYGHPDLAANLWVNSAEYYGDPNEDDDNNGYVDDIRGWDFVNDDNDPKDDNYHGTHVAGIIGAVGNNNTGVVGVCWQVEIMNLKSYDENQEGTWANCIKAIEYAVDMGAKVINASWGGYTGDPNQSLKDAIDAADASGVLFVAAAGNDHFSIDDPRYHPFYPAKYDSDNIISVMATDQDDHKSDFSNWGPVSVDLGAPGGWKVPLPFGDDDILSTMPTYETDKMAALNYSTYYDHLAGTSMAAPHVSGACALIWSSEPSVSHHKIKDILLDTVDSLYDLDGLCVSGGRLNVYKALSAMPSWDIFVAPDGNDNNDGLSWATAFATIQKGIDEAEPGDTVVVAEDTYNESIDFDGKSITVTSIDPEDPDVVANTIIDANGANKVVIFDSGEDENAVLTGFTLKAYSTGVHCSSTSPTISNCVVTNGSSYSYGILCFGYTATPTITGCVIKNSSYCGIMPYGTGGTISDCVIENCTYGIYCYCNHLPLTIENNYIRNNSRGIYVYWTYSGVTLAIRNNWMYENYTAGIETNSSNSPGIFTNNTIVGDYSNYGIHVSYGTAPTVSNCILWGNDDDLSGCSAAYSCIEDGDAGTGNISSDPSFVDAENHDYHLSSDSPCIDTGDSNGTYTGEVDIDGDDRVIDIWGKGDGTVDVDMGADEYHD